MKKILFILFIIIGSLFFSGCCGLCFDPEPNDDWDLLNTSNIFNPGTSTSNTTSGTDTTWTIMVYLDGDNNLEENAIDDLNEMEFVGSSDNVNIITLFDRTEGWDTSNGDWTGAKTYYVEQDNDMDIINSKVLRDMGEINMGDPSTLTDFITWTKDKYPADNYVLILWDHGAGHEGICWDDDNHEDYLELTELESALEKSDTHFEIIGFDACLMSTLEIASIIDTHGNVMIASQESEPVNGWEYSSFLNKLKANPNMHTNQFSMEIINGFYNSYYQDPSARDITLSAVDLTKINNIVDKYSTFRNKYNIEQSKVIAGASYHAYKYGGDTYMLGDLAQFMYIISAQSENEMQNEAQEILRLTKEAVIYEVHGPASPASRGLSTYLPNVITETNIEYSQQDYAIADYVEYSETVMQEIETPKVNITSYDNYLETGGVAMSDVIVTGEDLGDVYFLISTEIDNEILIINMDPIILETNVLENGTMLPNWETTNDFYFEWEGDAFSITDYIDHVPVIALPVNYGSDYYMVEGVVTTETGEYEATLLFNESYQMYSVELYEDYDGTMVPFDYEPQGDDYFSPFIFTIDEQGELNEYLLDDIIFFLTDDIYLDYYYLPSGEYYTGFIAENVIGGMELDVNEVTLDNPDELE